MHAGTSLPFRLDQLMTILVDAQARQTENRKSGRVKEVIQLWGIALRPRTSGPWDCSLHEWMMLASLM